ncbi:hypothetical protein E2C01_037600 [Portunus trituberculatus]|uniref:Uncharacterized protein n=1 Tax=Portunus trituberculatus TaxID=210409 RepID=A0A5B7FBU5_PORTR|nr:hypothetical protein [Portunus trituberculatus]
MASFSHVTLQAPLTASFTSPSLLPGTPPPLFPLSPLLIAAPCNLSVPPHYLDSSPPPPSPSFCTIPSSASWAGTRNTIKTTFKLPRLYGFRENCLEGPNFR